MWPAGGGAARRVSTAPRPLPGTAPTDCEGAPGKLHGLRPGGTGRGGHRASLLPGSPCLARENPGGCVLRRDHEPRREMPAGAEGAAGRRRPRSWAGARGSGCGPRPSAPPPGAACRGGPDSPPAPDARRVGPQPASPHPGRPGGPNFPPPSPPVPGQPPPAASAAREPGARRGPRHVGGARPPPVPGRSGRPGARPPLGSLPLLPAGSLPPVRSGPALRSPHASARAPPPALGSARQRGRPRHHHAGRAPRPPEARPLEPRLPGAPPRRTRPRPRAPSLSPAGCSALGKRKSAPGALVVPPRGRPGLQALPPPGSGAPGLGPPQGGGRAGLRASRARRTDRPSGGWGSRPWTLTVG